MIPGAEGVTQYEQKRLLPYTHLAGSSVQLCHKVEMLLLVRRLKKKLDLQKSWYRLQSPWKGSWGSPICWRKAAAPCWEGSHPLTPPAPAKQRGKEQSQPLNWAFCPWIHHYSPPATGSPVGGGSCSHHGAWSGHGPAAGGGHQEQPQQTARCKRGTLQERPWETLSAVREPGRALLLLVKEKRVQVDRSMGQGWAEPMSCASYLTKQDKASADNDSRTIENYCKYLFRWNKHP